MTLPSSWKLLPGQSVVVLLGPSGALGKAEEIEAHVRAVIGEKGHFVRVDQGEAIPQGQDAVITFLEKGEHNADLLERIIKALKPNAIVALHEPLAGRTATDSENLSRSLTFSGFINPSISQWGEFLEISAVKPDWELGSAQKLNLKKKVPEEWKNKGVEDEELVDEDELLDEQERNSRPNTKRDDCEVGKTRKACKNCSCGRAEEEAAAPSKKLTLDMLENPGVNSGCGNCALGDAFRCGGCPYRGLPTFKVGEKITLPDSFLEDDI